VAALEHAWRAIAEQWIEIFMKLPIALLVAGLLLAGCATPEYLGARNECAPQAFQRYPVVNVAQLVTRTRPVQVPTGDTHCTTVQQGNVTQSQCKQVMRTEYRPYQETAIVDVNEAGRNTMMNACAAQLCQSRFGNPDCERKR
jgi:hypothetical protein